LQSRLAARPTLRDCLPSIAKLSERARHLETEGLGRLSQREPLERAQAAAYYHQALALADALGMHPLQAHCHNGLGTLYTITGRLESARAELSLAMALYRTMDMTFWLPQVQEALAEAR
jgi:hypothetical protein